MAIATLAGGCFWCTEAIFKRLKGVSSVKSGYAGGQMENPTYEDVSGGQTGHAESVQIEFDTKVLPYQKLLEIFLATHDPTTPNRQGSDVGPQYRSIVFYHDETQKETAQKLIKPPMVTQLVPYTNFFPAEEHHQDFYEKNGHSPYCMLVIDPKIKKLLDHYGNQVKEEYLK